MVAGVAIDEQRAQREASIDSETNADVSTEAGPSSFGGDDSDDERDPNDIVVKDPGPSASTTLGAYHNLDESDYESQDSD